MTTAALEADGAPTLSDRFARAYQRARQHSVRVRKLKIILPIAAVVVSLVFVAVSFIRTWLPENIKIEGARIEDGKVVMEKPAISGRNSDGVSYSMTAARALQEILNPDRITLQDIKAAVPVNADLIARVVASEGLFNRGTNMLDLTAPFTIVMSSGLEASFQSALLDIDAGKMESQDPVSIRTQQASIVAQTLKMTDKGRTITFEGKVRVNVDSAAIRNPSN